jgi:pimeloyl-ACP methyl ester carboxylesterase
MTETTSKSVELPQGTVSYRDSGEGEPLVFMHGLLMNGTIWDSVVADLQATYRCIVPELPLGAHPVALRADADVSPLGVAQLVDDFLAALELEAVTLIGNDSGGAIAQLVAAHHPQRLGRLVLTPCDAYENFLPPLFRYLQLAARVPMAPNVLLQGMRIPGVRRTPIAFGWLAKKRIDSKLLDAWLGPAMQSSSVRRDLTKLLRGISSRDTITAVERLKSADLPVLVAWAPEDRFFPMKYGERLARDIPGATLVTIEDSYTLVSLDQPERTSQLIAEFVRKGPVARGSVDGALG